MPIPSYPLICILLGSLLASVACSVYFLYKVSLWPYCKCMLEKKLGPFSLISWNSPCLDKIFSFWNEEWFILTCHLHISNFSSIILSFSFLFQVIFLIFFEVKRCDWLISVKFLYNFEFGSLQVYFILYLLYCNAH